MSIFLVIGAIIGLGVMALIYRKELFPKKEKLAPIPHDNPEPIGEPKKYFQDDYKLSQIITQKIRDLQDQLIRHRQAVDGFQLDPKDIIRYEAMIEILKAVIQN